MFRQMGNRPLPSLAKNCQYAYDTMIEVLSYGILLCQFHGIPYCNFYPNLTSFTTCLHFIYLFIFAFFAVFPLIFHYTDLLRPPFTTDRNANHSSFSSQPITSGLKTTNNTTLQFANQHTDQSLATQLTSYYHLTLTMQHKLPKRPSATTIVLLIQTTVSTTTNFAPTINFHQVNHNDDVTRLLSMDLTITLLKMSLEQLIFTFNLNEFSPEGGQVVKWSRVHLKTRKMKEKGTEEEKTTRK